MNEMNDLYELTVYTASGAVVFTVKGTDEDFEERLSEALEEGAVLLDTAEGGRLLLNPVNTVAIEMRKAADTPPG